MTSPEVEHVDDEDTVRSYDAEPQLVRIATEELRRVRNPQLAYPELPGR